MKKLTTLLLLTLLTVSSVWADVEINTTNFPDENFRSYLLAQDYGKDGVLTEAEIASVTNMSVSQKSIKSQQGIEYFTALSVLDCRSNLLASIDLSKNTALIEILCSNNQLTSLKVSQNTTLTKLWCMGNQLASLDVKGCTALEYL